MCTERYTSLFKISSLDFSWNVCGTEQLWRCCWKRDKKRNSFSDNIITVVLFLLFILKKKKKNLDFVQSNLHYVTSILLTFLKNKKMKQKKMMIDLKDVLSYFYSLLNILLTKWGNDICTYGDPVRGVVSSTKWGYWWIDDNFFVTVVPVLSGTIELYRLQIIWLCGPNSRIRHNHTLRLILHHTGRGVLYRARSRTILQLPLSPGLSWIRLWIRKSGKSARSTFSPFVHSRCKRQPKCWCTLMLGPRPVTERVASLWTTDRPAGRRSRRERR